MSGLACKRDLRIGPCIFSLLQIRADPPAPRALLSNRSLRTVRIFARGDCLRGSPELHTSAQSGMTTTPWPPVRERRKNYGAYLAALFKTENDSTSGRSTSLKKNFLSTALSSDKSRDLFRSSRRRDGSSTPATSKKTRSKIVSAGGPTNQHC